MKQINITQKAFDYQSKVREKYHGGDPNIEDVGDAYMDGWTEAERTAKQEIRLILAEVHKQIRHGLIINANVVYDMFEKLLQKI